MALIRQRLISTSSSTSFICSGSAGTEIACLIKSLIQRLGLDQPEHAYKLRLLASSASLPLEGAEGVQSRTYLRDLFAPFGTSISEDDPGSTDPRFWNECIIQGVRISLARAGGIPSEPFAQLMMAALEGKDGFVGILDRTPALEAAISKAAAALGVVATAQARLRSTKRLLNMLVKTMTLSGHTRNRLLRICPGQTTLSWLSAD